MTGTLPRQITFDQVQVGDTVRATYRDQIGDSAEYTITLTAPLALRHPRGLPKKVPTM